MNEPTAAGTGRYFPVRQKYQPISEDGSVSFVNIPQGDFLNDELKCAICLGTLCSTYTVMVCLHRFCSDCIHRTLRMDVGNAHHSCPSCRATIASRRASIPDLNFDSLIQTLTFSSSSSSSSSPALDLSDYRKAHRENVESFRKRQRQQWGGDARERKQRKSIPDFVASASSSSSSSSATSGGKIKFGLLPFSQASSQVSEEVIGDGALRPLLEKVTAVYSENNNSISGSPRASSLSAMSSLTADAALRKAFLQTPGSMTVADLQGFLAIKLRASSSSPAIDPNSIQIVLMHKGSVEQLDVCMTLRKISKSLELWGRDVPLLLFYRPMPTPTPTPSSQPLSSSFDNDENNVEK